MATTTPTRVNRTATKRAPRRAATASRSRSTRPAAKRSQATTSTTPSSIVGDYAQRAVLIPVGAALIAKDRVVSGVNDVVSSYGSPSRAQVQLRKFERRGSTARNRLEREVRKTRTRVEREVRQRRQSLESHRESVSKRLSDGVEQRQAQIEKTQNQIERAVRARLKDGAEFAERLQERVLNVV